jgi:hypothetical protein
MATAAFPYVTARATAHIGSAEHIKRFERKIVAVQQAVDRLPGEEYFATLLSHIHSPGWTTPAESVFFETILDTMLAHAHHLGILHQQLMTGAAAVGRGQARNLQA